MSKRQFRLAPVAAAALALASPASHAQWQVQPGVQLRELYSDNVALQPDSLKEGQFVTELMPSLAILHKGPRLVLNSLVRLSAYAYGGARQEGTRRSSHEAQLSAQATLLDDLLYFSGQGMSAPRAVSPFAQPVSNGYTTANQDQVTTWSLSPYLQHRFDGGNTALLRFSRDHVAMATQGVGSSDSNNVLLSLNSDPRRGSLSWGLQYNRQDLKGAQMQDSTTEELSSTLRYRLTGSLSLRVGAGHDKYDFSPLGGSTAGRSWNTGFAWTPSPRTSLDASIGHRFVGPVKSLLAMHRSRNTVWNISYDDTVTTSRDNFLLPATVDTFSMLDRLYSARITDPALRRAAVEAYIRQTGLPATLADSINYFSNRYYLQKQLRASVALNSARTTTLLSLYRTRRDGLSTRQSDSTLLGSSANSINDNVLQRGANVALTYRLSPRSTLALNQDISRGESLSGGVATHYNISRLAYTRKLASKLAASLEARHTSGSVGNGNYVENSVIAALTYQK